MKVIKEEKVGFLGNLFNWMVVIGMILLIGRLIDYDAVLISGNSIYDLF
ncbi:hypothetical protein P8767_06655 [Peribacillus frigoritolerans]|nr:hypothetical protein [Peribacillus frigoritolerans]